MFSYNISLLLFHFDKKHLLLTFPDCKIPTFTRTYNKEYDPIVVAYDISRTVFKQNMTCWTEIAYDENLDVHYLSILTDLNEFYDMEDFDYINIDKIDEETSVEDNARLNMLCKLAFDSNNFEIKRI